MRGRPFAGRASLVRGRGQVAQKLARRGWLPDLIMSSNSLRTRQTLQAMAEAAAAFGAAETHLLGSLYTVAALDGQTLKHLQARRPACAPHWASSGGAGTCRRRRGRQRQFRARRGWI